MNFLRKTSHVSSFLQVSYFPVSFVTAWFLKNEIRFKIKMIKFWNKSLVTNISCVHLLFFPFFIIFRWKYFFWPVHISRALAQSFLYFFLWARTVGSGFMRTKYYVMYNVHFYYSLLNKMLYNKFLFLFCQCSVGVFYFIPG